MPTHGLSPLWSLSSCLPRVQYEQHDAADQRHRSDDRGNKVPLRGLYVQRADIDRLSSGLVSDARVSEHHDADNDQYAGYDGFGSHGTSSFLASIRQTNGFSQHSSSLNDPEQHHKIFTELGFTYVEDGCDGFCPQCKQKLTCDLYDEFKDEWEALYRNN